MAAGLTRFRWGQTLKQSTGTSARGIYTDATYSGTTSMWGNCPILAALCDPSIAHIYHNDFHSFLVGDWVQTVVGTTPTATIADAAGGILTLTTSASDNDAIQIQLGTINAATGESFKLASTKPLWFETRIATSDADTKDWFVGLAVADTTILGDGTETTQGFPDGLGFGVKAGDSSQAVLFCTKATTETASASLGTIADDTYIKLGFYYDGTTVTPWYNGTEGTAISATIPSTELKLTFAVRNAGAGADTFSIDYAKIVQVR